MLVVISPAKRLDWSEAAVPAVTDPAFQSDAVALAQVARGLDVAALRKLMHISEDLARLNRDRFADFADAPDPQQTRPAALAFAGDTYAGLEARTLDPDALRWAQDHLRILSGLYGLLRPLDRIQPYRLEMGSRLVTQKGQSLYDYWSDRLSHALNEAASAVGAKVLVNCASVEYFSAVRPEALRPRVITPVFMEDRGGSPKIVSFYAKKARGAMARFIVEHRLTDPRALTAFDAGGYRHAPDLSEEDRPVFLRSGEASEAA
ncbi:peroxide stress protein YaaA [Plastorhodobacter daqingensis]|uniref:UPF0246 protein ACFQXB_16885 n=1 Tax=Plastorhodobacter daqingensis TaxID=1387281 RepID=A0ABW2UMV6_9RHOB